MKMPSSLSGVEIAAFMQRRARELGLAAVGSADAAPATSFGRFQAWLERGCAAGMQYLSRHADLRRDPRLLMPGARSVIAAAIRYPAKSVNPAYSSHAQGRDYHKVLAGILHELAGSMMRFVGAPFEYRVCVDSSPILEREWAARAGLGWVGRQGSLVHPQHGCRLFLGLILTEIELPAAQPMAGQCGACRRCVEACPTGAISAEGFLDARRCLSYLTIEHRGPMPEGAVPAGTASLFGCDACTAACPFNSADEASVHAELRPVPQAASWPGPDECATLDEREFQRFFEGTVIQRLGLERLQRNARAIVQARSMG